MIDLFDLFRDRRSPWEKARDGIGCGMVLMAIIAVILLGLWKLTELIYGLLG